MEKLDENISSHYSPLSRIGGHLRDVIAAFIKKAWDLRNMSHSDNLQFFADLYNFTTNNRRKVNRIGHSEFNELFTFFKINESLTNKIITNLVHKQPVDKNTSIAIANAIASRLNEFASNIVLLFESAPRNVDRKTLISDAYTVLSEIYEGKSVNEQILFIKFMHSYISNVKKELRSMVPKKLRTNTEEFKQAQDILDGILHKISLIQFEPDAQKRLVIISDIAYKFQKVRILKDTLRQKQEMQALKADNKSHANEIGDAGKSKLFIDILQQSRVKRENLTSVFAFIKKIFKRDFSGSEASAIKNFVEKGKVNKVMLSIIEKVVEWHNKKSR